MHGQMSLYRTAVTDLHVQAHHSVGRGWEVRVGARRQLETWGEADKSSYDFLSTAELLDVVCAALGRILDGAGDPGV